MRLLIVLVISAWLPCIAMSQPSDIISVQKRNGRIIKNFGAGSRAIFLTESGDYTEGVIRQIQNDTLFVVSYRVSQFATSYGGLVLDTLAYPLAVHYKDIRSIQLFEHRGLFHRRISALLMIGGAGYVVLNIVNGLYRKESFTDRKDLVTLGASTLAFGTGWALRKYSRNGFSSKKHRIVYVHVR